jgi:hypothetical protein
MFRSLIASVIFGLAIVPANAQQTAVNPPTSANTLLPDKPELLRRIALHEAAIL